MLVTEGEKPLPGFLSVRGSASQCNSDCANAAEEGSGAPSRLMVSYGTTAHGE
jgi:hypothetical protein